MHNKIQDLKSCLEKIAYVGSAVSMLHWDQQVNMPKGAVDFRSNQLAYLESWAHKMQTGEELKSLLSRVVDLESGEVVEKELSEEEKIFAFESWRDWRASNSLPDEFVEEFSRAQAKSFMAWQEAKQTEQFSLFENHLENMVSYAKKKANFLNPNIPTYDALIDTFEPYMTTAKLDLLFGELKSEVMKILEKIKKADIAFIDLNVSAWAKSSQERFIESVLNDLGYDLECGRQDFSEHPFSIAFHPTDARITTYIKENDIKAGILASIHECGHALYEQGLNPKWFATPLSEAVSFGVHESQSRFYETRLGLSKPFWDWYFPILKSHFNKQLKGITSYDFYKSMNQVIPGPIRLEAEELTYNLHIIIRYEIEKQMMNDDLTGQQISEIWNNKYEEYLGVKPRTYAEGVLQDVHWSEGYIGYFPSYVLGCIYASQLYEKMLEDMPDMEEKISRGEFIEIRNWLKVNIQEKGRLKKPADLIKDVTGREITIKPYVDYLNKKFGQIYGF